MDKKNKFDAYLNKQVDSLPESFDPADWGGIEAILDKDKKKKILWWYFALPAVIAIAGAYIVWQNQDEQPLNNQQVVASVTIPKNIVSSNEQQKLYETVQENNLATQSNIIKPTQHDAINNNTKIINVSNPIVSINDKRIILSETKVTKVEPQNIDFVTPIKYIYPAQNLQNNFTFDNTMLTLGKLPAIRPKKQKPKFARNELSLFGERGIGFFELYNKNSASIDKKNLYTQGIGLDYKYKVSKKIAIGFGVGMMAFNIKEGYTVVDSQITSRIHSYMALEMNIKTGKIEEAIKTEQLYDTTIKTYNLGRNTFVNQQHISVSLNYLILDKKNFEIGMGVFERFTCYNTLVSKVNLDGYATSSPLDFNYNSYVTKYNNLGVSLNMKYRFYKGIYIQYEPMFITNTSYNMNNLNPRYQWNNRLGLTFKW